MDANEQGGLITLQEFPQPGYIVVRNPDGLSYHVPLLQDHLRVGRQSDCESARDDPLVSRQHAE